MAISSQAPQECGEGSETSAYSPERTMGHHERAAVRTCGRCKETQPHDAFSKTGFYCKKCHGAYLKLYRAKHRDELNAGKKQWYYANRARVLSKKKEYTKQVSAHVIARRRKQRESNPEAMAKHNFNMAIRRHAEARATPKWADRKQIEAFYLEAQMKSQETGVKHSVDHIYPLRGKFVSGLHVPENLRVITLSQNCSKQNKTDEIVRTATETCRVDG